MTKMTKNCWWELVMDNGSGYGERIGGPAPTQAEALKMSGMKLGRGMWFEEVEPPNPNERPCQCGSGEPWAACGAQSQYCG